jgi:DNA invertase Pin-like site-specific DNA recombinase
MSHLLLSVMGAFAQFERDLIRERQREGIALAKLREGAYTGRKHSLLRRRPKNFVGFGLMSQLNRRPTIAFTIR